MSKKSYLLLLTISLLLTTRCVAISSIGFGAYTLSDSIVKQGDTLIIRTSLLNYGPDIFNGKVGFSFAINGTQNVNRSIFNNPIEQQTISIAPNDSFPLTIGVVVQPQYLVPGSDIFVVWPIVKNGNWVHDSLAVRFTVEVATPVEETSELPMLKMKYINHDLEVDYTGQPEPLDIRLFDINGRCIYSATIESTCHISFNNQPAGMYFIEAISATKARKVYKIVKADR